MKNLDFAYFDYAATTPIDARILQFYIAELTNFANPGATYDLALAQRKRLQNARELFAQNINADAREIIFTSSATEANNLALKGALYHQDKAVKRLITVKTEHKAILDTAAFLQKSGFKVDYLNVNPEGLINLNELEEALQHGDKALVSIMAVNNETGVLQNLAAISALVHQYGGKLHVDAAQALGKIRLDVREIEADLISFSAHKVYAPIGVGALFVRRMPKMRLSALIHGGGQEQALRSGTLAIPLISAFAEALQLANQEFSQRYQYISDLNKRFLAELPSNCGANIRHAQKVPHIENIYTHLFNQEALQRANEANIAISAGSACQSSASISHVLQAMQCENASHSLRISFSHLTKNEELEKLINFLRSL